MSFGVLEGELYWVIRVWGFLASWVKINRLGLVLMDTSNGQYMFPPCTSAHLTSCGAFGSFSVSVRTACRWKLCLFCLLWQATTSLLSLLLAACCHLYHCFQPGPHCTATATTVAAASVLATTTADIGHFCSAVQLLTSAAFAPWPSHCFQNKGFCRRFAGPACMWTFIAAPGPATPHVTAIELTGSFLSLLFL